MGRDFMWIGAQANKSGAANCRKPLVLDSRLIAAADRERYAAQVIGGGVVCMLPVRRGKFRVL